MKELRTKAIKRAARYEEKARQSKKKIIVECMKEIEKRKESEEESKCKKRKEEGCQRRQTWPKNT